MTSGCPSPKQGVLVCVHTALGTPSGTGSINMPLTYTRLQQGNDQRFKMLVSNTVDHSGHVTIKQRYREPSNRHRPTDVCTDYFVYDTQNHAALVCCKSSTGAHAHARTRSFCAQVSHIKSACIWRRCCARPFLAITSIRTRSSLCHRYVLHVSARYLCVRVQRLDRHTLRALDMRGQKARHLPMCLHATQVAVPLLVPGRDAIIRAPLPHFFMHIMKKLQLVLPK